MAEKDISDLDQIAAGDVDRSADFLELHDTTANQSKKVTPNALMNISGAAVGTTDSQTLTNKTITSPTISNPVLSGTLTGTYTIGGSPTFPASVATLTGVQTLTNKTLTSPTINTATIVNPTLTVDTISEHTAANGVTIDGVLLKDSKMNGSYITDNSITGSQLSTYKVVRQNDTTTTTETVARILSGWGVITLTSGVLTYNETVTFGTAFASRPIVTVTHGGDAATASGSSYGTGGNVISGSWYIKAYTITTTGFTVKMDTSSVGANGFAFYQWIAMGA